MNPLFAAMVGILYLQKRKCPKCHREQSVPADKISKALPCKYCVLLFNRNRKTQNSLPENTKQYYFISPESSALIRFVEMWPTFANDIRDNGLIIYRGKKLFHA